MNITNSKAKGILERLCKEHSEMLSNPMMADNFVAVDSPASTLFNKTPKERKQAPIGTGVIDYFPDALAAVAYCSFVGNEQHNPGTPLHWDRSKSGDESDALMRHFVHRGTMDSDGVLHSAKVCWRALAMLQKEIEAHNV